MLRRFMAAWNLSFVLIYISDLYPQQENWQGKKQIQNF